MLRISQSQLDRCDRDYPGLREQVEAFESQQVPDCVHCGGSDVAVGQVGIIGRTICLAAATSRIKLIPNAPKPGEYFCHACRNWFDAPARVDAVPRPE